MKHQYEIYVMGEDNPFHTFEDAWVYKKSERVFVKKEGILYSLIINSITHDVTDVPIVRLNCQKRKYQN